MLLKQNKLKNRLLSGFLAVLIATTSVVPNNVMIANAEGVSTTTKATASTAPTNAPAATESASTKDAEATTAQDSSIEKSGTKITTKTELISIDEVQSNSDNSKVEIAKNYTQPSLGLLKIDGNVISSGCVGYFGTYNRTANWSQVMHHYYILDSANAAKNYCFCTEPELKNGKDRVYKLKESSTKKTGKADNGLSSTNILARFGHYYKKNPSNYRYKIVQAVEWTYANRTDSKFLDQVKTALGNVGITGDKRKNLIDTITSSSYDSIDVPYALYENSGAKRQKMRVWGRTLLSGQAEFDTFSKNYKYRSRILIEKHDQFGHWLGGVKFRVSIPFRYSENDLDVIGRSDIRGAEKFIEDESKLEEDENAAGTMDDKFRVNSPNDKDSEYTPWHYSVELITRDKRQSLKGKAGMYATYIGTTNSYAYLESLKYESTDIKNLALSNLDQVIPDPYASAKWSYHDTPVHITKGTTTWRQLIKKLYNKWNEADNEDDDADNSCINKAPGWSKDGAEKQVDKDIQNALDDDQIKKRYRIEELGFAFGEKYTYIDPDTDEQSQRTVDVAQCLPDGITSADAIIMNPGIKEQEVSLGADNTWIKEIGADIHWIDLEPKWNYEKVYHFDAMNPRKQLSVGIQKKAMWNSNIPLANAEYTVYTNENCTNMAKDINGNVIKLTTNANGLGFAKFIPSKSTADSAITNGKTWNDMDAEYTFYVKETKAAEYTEINTSVYKITVDYDGLGGANDPFTHTEGCYTATDKDCAGTNHTHYYKNFICTDDGSSFMKLLTTAGSWMSIGSDGLYKDNKVAYETTYTKIDMKKIDGNISAKYDLPISGATFTFYDQNQITKNADGTYVLKENATPITYSKPWYANNGKNDGKTVTITTGTGNSQSDKLYITPSMITEGYNNTQDKLNGTKLTLYAVETSVSKNGIAKWYDCPGKSVVYELSGLLNANPAENVLTPQSFCIVDKNGNAKLTKFKKGNNNGDAISDYAHLQLSISKKDAALLRKTGDDLWINGAKYGVFADKDCKKSVTYNYPSYIGDGDDYEGYAIETGTDGSKPRVPQVAGAKYTWVSDRNNNVVMTTLAKGYQDNSEPNNTKAEEYVTYTGQFYPDGENQIFRVNYSDGTNSGWSNEAGFDTSVPTGKTVDEDKPVTWKYYIKEISNKNGSSKIYDLNPSVYEVEVSYDETKRVSETNIIGIFDVNGTFVQYNDTTKQNYINAYNDKISTREYSWLQVRKQATDKETQKGVGSQTLSFGTIEGETITVYEDAKCTKPVTYNLPHYIINDKNWYKKLTGYDMICDSAQTMSDTVVTATTTFNKNDKSAWATTLPFYPSKTAEFKLDKNEDGETVPYYTYYVKETINAKLHYTTHTINNHVMKRVVNYYNEKNLKDEIIIHQIKPITYRQIGEPLQSKSLLTPDDKSKGEENTWYEEDDKNDELFVTKGYFTLFKQDNNVRAYTKTWANYNSSVFEENLQYKLAGATNLAGARYKLIAAENIYHPDGQTTGAELGISKCTEPGLLYKAGDPIKPVKFSELKDANGKVVKDEETKSTPVYTNPDDREDGVFVTDKTGRLMVGSSDVDVRDPYDLWPGAYYLQEIPTSVNGNDKVLQHTSPTGHKYTVVCGPTGYSLDNNIYKVIVPSSADKKKVPAEIRIGGKVEYSQYSGKAIYTYYDDADDEVEEGHKISKSEEKLEIPLDKYAGVKHNIVQQYQPTALDSGNNNILISADKPILLRPTIRKVINKGNKIDKAGVGINFYLKDRALLGRYVRTNSKGNPIDKTGKETSNRKDMVPLFLRENQTNEQKRDGSYSNILYDKLFELYEYEDYDTTQSDVLGSDLGAQVKQDTTNKTITYVTNRTQDLKKVLDYQIQDYIDEYNKVGYNIKGDNKMEKLDTPRLVIDKNLTETVDETDAYGNVLYYEESDKEFKNPIVDTTSKEYANKKLVTHKIKVSSVADITDYSKLSNDTLKDIRQTTNKLAGLYNSSNEMVYNDKDEIYTAKLGMELVLDKSGNPVVFYASDKDDTTTDKADETHTIKKYLYRYYICLPKYDYSDDICMNDAKLSETNTTPDTSKNPTDDTSRKYGQFEYWNNTPSYGANANVQTTKQDYEANGEPNGLIVEKQMAERWREIYTGPFTTNSDGIAIGPCLPYGLYTIEESYDSAKQIHCVGTSAFDFTVNDKAIEEYGPYINEELARTDESGSGNKTYSIVNVVRKFKVQLVKYDLATKKQVLLGGKDGASFKIYKIKEKSINGILTPSLVAVKAKQDGVVKDEFTTNINGVAELESSDTDTEHFLFEEGKYVITEIKAPTNYFLTKSGEEKIISPDKDVDYNEDIKAGKDTNPLYNTKYQFVIDAGLTDFESVDYNLGLIKVGAYDKELKGRILVEKQAPFLIGYDETTYLHKSHTAITFLYENQKLPGAKFEIRPAETIYTSDHQYNWELLKSEMSTEKVYINEYNSKLNKTETKVTTIGKLDNYTDFLNALVVTNEFDEKYYNKLIDKIEQYRTVAYVDGVALKGPDTVIETISTSYNDIEIPDDAGSIKVSRGQAISSQLPPGKYIVTEIKAPYGSVLSEDNQRSQTVTITGDDSTKEVSVEKVNFKNERQEVGLDVLKYDAEQGKDIPVAGAEFTLYAASDIYNTEDDGEELEVNGGVKKVIMKKGTEIEKATSDENGHIEFNANNTLPFGKYYAVETKVPSGYYSLPDDYKVTFDIRYDDTKQSESKIYLKSEVPNIKTHVRFAKTDFYSHKFISGAVLQVIEPEMTEDNQYVLDSNNQIQGKVVAEWTTNKDEMTPECDNFASEPGHLVEGLTVGKEYVLREVKAPNSYVNLAYASQKVKDANVGYNSPKYRKADDTNEYTDIFFTVKDAKYDKDGKLSSDLQSVTMIDEHQRGRILINKTGTFLTSVDEATVDMVSTYLRCIFNYSDASLGKVTYTVRANEDIYDEVTDTTIQKGTIVDTITTDSLGFAMTKELPLGKYTITEDNSADGHIRSTESINVELTYGDQTLRVVPNVNNYKNGYAKVEIKAKKVDENNKPLSGAVFALYTKEDIKGYTLEDTVSSSIIDDENNASYNISTKVAIPNKNALVKKDTAVDYAVTDSDGIAKFTANIPYGKYYVKEIVAPAGYSTNLTIYDLDCTFSGDDTKKVQTYEFTCVDTQNEIYTVKVNDSANLESGMTDYSSNIKNLKENQFVYGATLQITDANGKVIDTWVSDGTNHITKGLVSGQTYWLKEISPADGYTTADPIKFTVPDYRKQDKQETIEVTDNSNANVSTSDVKDSVSKEFTFKDKDGIKVKNLSHIQFNVYATPLDSTEKTYVDTTVVDNNASMKVNFTEGYSNYVLEAKAEKIHQIDTTGLTIKFNDTLDKAVVNWPSQGINDVSVNIKDSNIVLDSFKAVEVAETENSQVVSAGAQQLVMVDHKTKMSFTKSDITTGKEIPGAKLQVIDVKTNKVVEEWISTTTPHQIEGLSLGKYILREIMAPTDLGYIKSEDVYFTVEDTNVIQNVVMKDDYTKLYVSKRSITTSEELPGAKLQIIDSKGNIVEQWTSTKEEHLITYLPVGTYTLREITAPNGYATAEDIQFTMTETGLAQHVVMYDSPTKIKISKVDITNNKELPGAKLQIIDSKGELVDQWTSTRQAHYIENLPVGTYTLREITAPNGYEIAEDVKFKVLDTDEIQTVVMKDKHIQKKAKPHKKVKQVEPKTGDTNNILLYTIITIISGCALLFVFKRKRKNQHND